MPYICYKILLIRRGKGGRGEEEEEGKRKQQQLQQQQQLVQWGWGKGSQRPGKEPEKPPRRKAGIHPTHHIDQPRVAGACLGEVINNI